MGLAFASVRCGTCTCVCVCIYEEEDAAANTMGKGARERGGRDREKKRDGGRTEV